MAKQKLMAFKDKLKELRNQKGLTQEALADAIAVSRSAIAKYENGNGLPSDETLKIIADYFSIDVSELKDANEQHIKKKPSPLKKAFFSTDVFLIGAIVACFIIITIAIVVSIAHGYENDRLIAHADCRSGSEDIGNCNYSVTQMWRSRIANLAIYSHIILASIVLISLVAFMVNILIRKKDREQRFYQSASFIKYFLAVLIADIGLMYTVGMYCGFTKMSESILEYFFYTFDGLVIINLIYFLVDSLLILIMKKSFVFYYPNKRIMIFEIFSAFIMVIFSIVIIIGATVGEPFLFYIVQFFLAPIMFLFEIAIFIIKFFNFKNATRVRIENPEL